MWRDDVPKLWSSLRRAVAGSEVDERDRPISMGEWADFFKFGAAAYPILSSGSGVNVEDIENSFVGYVRGAYKSDGIVFACMLARQMLFSEARFQFQQMRKGRPGDLFGSPDLTILERPWPNGTTGELLSRMIQDADLAGNFFAVSEGNRLRRLRPDWVDIVLTAPPDQAIKSDVAGYLYHPGGVGNAEPVTYMPDQVVHWSPVPDPEAQYRGMSWLTPAIREIQADMAATDHKLRFFENGATLQTVLTLGESVTADQFKTFVRQFREAHQGVANAYEPLFLGGGADAKVIGTDLRQLDFKNTQGANETRIAADSGIHPVILGLSEGLAGSSLNAGNFNAARRLTADKALRPLWRMAAAALETVIRVPTGARLWYDDRDIAFLREDRKDLAEIQATEAQSIRTLLDAGWEATSVVAAVQAQDWSLLTHSGLFSVQLQPPGAGDPAPAGQEPPAQGDQG
jgi:phage portal protein BeeE